MKINFDLKTATGGIVAVEDVMQKDCGLVAVGIVKAGKISKGDEVEIHLPNKPPIRDRVKRIEIDHKEIETAEDGQGIGICLTDITKKGLIGN